MRSARALCASCRAPGLLARIVLDTYAAWVAEQLGLLGTLKTLFARVTVRSHD